MPHVIEAATSARAKCRGCEQKIAKGELRFGERQPNAFGEGEMTLWFHLACAAYKRPEPYLEAAQAADADETARALVPVAERGLAHRRLPRLDGAERAATGRARCRRCREPIEQGDWRVRIVFFEEFRFAPGGFVHLSCAPAYFETGELLDRIAYFSPKLTPAERTEIERIVAAAPQPPAPAPPAET